MLIPYQPGFIRFSLVGLRRVNQYSAGRWLATWIHLLLLSYLGHLPMVPWCESFLLRLSIYWIDDQLWDPWAPCWVPKKGWVKASKIWGPLTPS